jgi:hypothetical protein
MQERANTTWKRMVTAGGCLALTAAIAGGSATGCALEAGTELEKVETASEELTGDFIFETTFEGQVGTCPNPAEVESRIRAGYMRGRIGARSKAFVQCIYTAMTTGVIPEHVSGGAFHQIGPYKPCFSTSVPACDLPWLQTSTQPEHTAWLLSMSSSPLKLKARCDSRTGLTDETGGGYRKYESEVPLGIEGLRAVSVGSNPNRVAPHLWHEVAHNHGCGTDMSATACRVSSSEWDDGSNAMHAIVFGCMAEVLLRSEASASCASLQCPAGELPIIRDLDETACECVPDVYNWPTNENEVDDGFGTVLATGNFNGDAYDDLAVGSFGEDGYRGAVYLFRGSDYGLLYWKRITQTSFTAINFQVSPPSVSVPSADSSDLFGSALAAGDLNGDGSDELIVGTHGKNSYAGVVYIFGGGSQGLSFNNVQLLDQSANGGGAEASDLFGYALAVGNFNGDAYEDLAVGAPGEVYSGQQSGIVSIHKGRSATFGITSVVVSDGFIDQAPTWANENGDRFGNTLAAGDIDADGLDELVIGAPGENNWQGYVFRAERAPGWTLNLALTQAGADGFGTSLAIGDIIGSSTKDIVVGSPSDRSQAGSVWIYRGLTTGPVFATQLMGDETDKFGSSLAIAKVRGSGKADLIVGAPGEAWSSGPAEGRSLVYVGTTSNTFPTSWDVYLFQPDFVDAGPTDTALPPEVRSADWFGFSAAVGDFNGAGTGVVVGAPKDVVGGVQGAGAIFTYSPTLEDGRKFDQRTVRYGRASPPY